MRNYAVMAAQQTPVDVGGIVRPAGRPDLVTALQPHVGRLGDRAAAHLLRRAGFGGTPEQVRRYSAMTARDGGGVVAGGSAGLFDYAAARAGGPGWLGFDVERPHAT